ncbi:MAG: hypothetical protein IJA12_02635 [Oscillospiraceae bacterium]|nr:hypothetical protein [Oscillospiraceae bacterium]
MIIGNTVAEIQVYKSEKNEIGELVKKWETIQILKGFLDLIGGDSDYNSFNVKTEESTHVFICEYTPLSELITARSSRLIANGKSYDIMLIDNPMELNCHYEIYLKMTGGDAYA